MWKSVLYLIVYALISACGLLFIKIAFRNSADVSELLPRIGWLLRSPAFLFGMLLYVTGFVMWIAMLSRGELSYVFPVASGALYLAVTLLAVLVLHEAVTPLRIVGILAILIGIVLVGKS